jgi:hypothetical protein
MPVRRLTPIETADHRCRGRHEPPGDGRVPGDPGSAACRADRVEPHSPRGQRLRRRSVQTVFTVALFVSSIGSLTLAFALLRAVGSPPLASRDLAYLPVIPLARIGMTLFPTSLEGQRISRIDSSRSRSSIEAAFATFVAPCRAAGTWWQNRWGGFAAKPAEPRPDAGYGCGVPRKLSSARRTMRAPTTCHQPRVGQLGLDSVVRLAPVSLFCCPLEREFDAVRQPLIVGAGQPLALRARAQLPE